MLRCKSCNALIPEGGSFCLECGICALQDIGTTIVFSGLALPSTERPPLPKRVQRGRFVPGALIAGRYRIISPLGRGGMGDVYRVEDLKLGQAVALKFLPKKLAQNPETLARFHKEVRLARKVTHPHVCRVFDIGEAEGLPFLSMEYIDGENLASLLRRIGRLPADKAIEIAQQLCAGLAAIHASGIVHRDLKPANVMIDGKGRARIADFGISAVLTETTETDGSPVIGTPAYMAPEQLTKSVATARSDIYSLGLILYEAFTGQRLLLGETPLEIARLQTDLGSKPPSALVHELDPRIDLALLRCLDRDPAGRPASALDLATMLPGLHPLAAAVAAGKTPSPEMGAAAPKLGSLRPAAGLFCLVGVVLVCACVMAIASKLMLLARLRSIPQRRS